MLKNCTRLWRQAHFEVKMYKIPVFWHTFGPYNVGPAEELVSWSVRRLVS